MKITRILMLPLLAPFLTLVPPEVYVLCGGVLGHGPALSFIFAGMCLSACVFVWECCAMPYVLVRTRMGKGLGSLGKGELLSLFSALAYIVIVIVFAIDLTASR